MTHRPRIRSTPSRSFCIALVSGLGVALAVAWVGLPEQPPAGTWPSPSAPAAERSAEALAMAVAQAWTADEKQLAWQRAGVLLQAYPQTAPGRRALGLERQLAQASQAEQWARRWSYAQAGNARVGQVHQAQVAADSDPEGNAPAFLVLSHNPWSHQTAVFVVLADGVPPPCDQPTGCLVQVSSGAQRPEPARLLPVAGRPQAWRFSNPTRALDWLRARQPLVVSRLAPTALTFPIQGLDLDQAGLQAR